MRRYVTFISKYKRCAYPPNYHLEETMSGYKLYYFDARGRAEVVRLSFVAANMEYEDIRLTREEWVKEKECE